ncbi:hypothetical protein LTR49_027450 [Elasticomyces elasticus]|nr:hypothetical protein LTR49_027450 [Elasticomyces elasticus]
MTLDASLSQAEKLKQLEIILEDSIKTKTQSKDPASFPDDEHKTWRKLKFASGSFSRALGNINRFMAILRELYETDLNGDKDMSALHNLSLLLEEAGDYADSEAAAREVLLWLCGQAALGPDSPQALGCMRTLAELHLEAAETRRSGTVDRGVQSLHREDGQWANEKVHER